MRMILTLAALLFAGSAQAAAVFSKQRVTCGSVWMALDGSIECQSVFFKAEATNGTSTLSIDGPFMALKEKNAIVAQGKGICAYVGYGEFVSQTVRDLSHEPLPVRAAYGPFTTLNELGDVIALDKSGPAIVDSVTCK